MPLFDAPLTTCTYVMSLLQNVQYYILEDSSIGRISSKIIYATARFYLVVVPPSMKTNAW